MGDLHVVVFDVNILLDVAALMGPGFTEEHFTELATRHANAPCRNADRKVDSLRALAVCTSGRFAGHDRLEAWTSNHIEDLCYTKLGQPTNGPTPETKGFGWSDDDAACFVEDIGDYLLDSSGGNSCGEVHISQGSPPLEHEDGLVYATALAAGPSEASPIRYCVTNDLGFREQAPYSNVYTLYAHEWVNLVRGSRRRLAGDVPTGL